MFKRFTDRTRRVVVLAQEESRLLAHNYIGTEHLLLGLLHEGEGLAAQALTACDVSLDAARAEVEQLVGRGGSAPSGHIPFTVLAKGALERALREALQLGHNYIGTEHLLLGLLHPGNNSIAIDALNDLQTDPTKVRTKVLELISEDQGPEPAVTVPAAERTVFVVSGRTARRLEQVIQAVRDLTGRVPSVLHPQPPGASAHRAVVSQRHEHEPGTPVAVVLLDGDDLGARRTDEPLDLSDFRPRASQDTIYELGWFHGLLGHDRVVVLAEDGVETPGDLGIPYIALDPDGTWRARLADGLRAAGVDIDPHQSTE